MSAELNAKKKHLEALETFIASPAHDGYKVAIAEEIDLTKQSIIAIVPDNQKDFIEECQLRGELRLLQQELTRFEDARSRLKVLIDEMSEKEQQTTTQQR